MSYTLTHSYSFKTIDDIDCRVDIYTKDAPAGVKYLNPGARPFILREFNGDKDFFKPVRGFIAELEILSNNVSMDEFLNNEDDGVQVKFYFNNLNFWTGWLMQDDFEENWIDTNHYITLRATDGLGTIASQPMTQVVGQGSINNYLGYCLDETPLQFINRRWVCNLFYDGMNDRVDGEYSALDQATVEGKTFEGDSKDKVLDKVLRAWSMTVYQYYSEWYVARVEEWLTNTTIQGLEKDFLLPYEPFSKTYEVNIGVDETIKPIMPEMLRSIARPSKRNKISFYYRFPDEIFCNQTFLRGDVISPTTDTFDIECWTLLKGTFGSPVAGTTDWWRKEEKDVDGNITDNYLFIAADASSHRVVSEGLVLNVGDVLDISFDVRAQRNVSYGSANVRVAAILFETATDKYTLNEDGIWYLSNASYGINVQQINVSYSSTELLTDWKNVKITTNAMPGSGTLYVCFLNWFVTDTDTNFRGLEIEITEASKQPGVVGDYDVYTLADTINKDYEEEIFMDDSNNRQHKGAIHFSGALTGDNWYRMDFPTERLTFKRHKAIAHMFLNKRYRQRLQVNMFGNTWTDVTVKPIWLQNKFVFVDDAPTKKFMIVNLSEMNFSDATWKADLIEVWDSALDDNDPDAYAAAHTFANIYEKDR